MTNEEFEKRVEFILDQEARFASDIQQLQEAQARTEEALSRTEQAIAQTDQVVSQTVAVVEQTAQVVARLANVTSEGFKDVTAKINALVDSHIRLAGSQARTDDALRKLADGQAQTHDAIRKLTEGQVRTDDTLKSLIAVVDRYFREGRNGQTGQ